MADFEKACSITGNNFNVYACLVCGKYFQGRGTHTQAYTHALQVRRARRPQPPLRECPLSAPARRTQEGHHVFKNLHDGRVYCLPDGYEVVDKSLQAPRCVAHRVAHCAMHCVAHRVAHCAMHCAMHCAVQCIGE